MDRREGSGQAHASAPHALSRVYLGMDGAAPAFSGRRRSLSTSSATTGKSHPATNRKRSDSIYSGGIRRRSSVSGSWVGSHFDIGPHTPTVAHLPHPAQAAASTAAPARTGDSSLLKPTLSETGRSGRPPRILVPPQVPDPPRGRHVQFDPQGQPTPRHVSEVSPVDLAESPRGANGPIVPAEAFPSLREPPQASPGSSRGLATPPASTAILIDRMLVKASWVAKQQIVKPFDERAAKRYEPIEDPLTEYAVCLRKGVLQLYRERHAPWRLAGPTRPESKILTDEIVLDRSRTELSVFNPADCTFCLVVSLGGHHAHLDSTDQAASRRASFGSALESTREKHHKRAKILHVRHPGTTIYTFRPRSIRVAGLWLAELAHELDVQMPRVVPLKVQDLSATITMPLWSSEESEWDCKSGTAVLAEATRQFTSVPNFKELYDHMVLKGTRLGLAWRGPTMLRWIEDDADPRADEQWSSIVRNFVTLLAKEPPSLEVRPALHYPATVRLDGALIEEPAAVEGFVTRIRSGQANERVYVTSVDGFLFLVRPRDALTPRAPSAPDLPRGPARRLSISMPPLAFREPSSGTKSKFGRVFSSGGPSSSQQVSQDRPSAGVRLGDTVQAHEANRLRDMLKRSFAFIDMREISGVTALMPEDDGPDASTATDYGHGKDASRASHPGSKTRRPGFEIEFSGGRRVRFETTHPEVAQEWVERLPALIKYWKKRWEVDVKVRMTAQTDEVGGSLTDTEHARSRALSSIYHHCIIEACRPLAMYGPLSKKSDSGGERWKSRFVILSGSTLQEFLVLERTKMGEVEQTDLHRQRFTMSLQDCYILSGELCEQILGRHARGATRPTSARPKKEGRGSFASKVPFLRDEEAVQRQRENEARAKHQLRRDAQQPPPRMQRSAAWDPDEAELAFRGANPKARLYADGLRTVAQPADLCFVIWKKATALGEDDMVLGSRHTLRAYRARSRLERDEWLFALNHEVSRLHDRRDEREIRLRSFKGVG